MMLEKITLTQAALGAVAIGGGIVALSILYNFVCWLGLALLDTTKTIISRSSNFLINATAQISAGITGAVATLLHIAGNLFLTAILWITQPIKSSVVKFKEKLAAYGKLRQLYWKYGHTEFKSFAEFKRHMVGEQEPEPQPEPESRKTSFQEAQEILGFTGTEPNTLTELKARHRQLMSVLHPDKGVPSSYFAQQVNDAVKLIMGIRKWK